MKTLLFLIALIFTVNINAQIVNIPDANFKAYLVGNKLINTNSDKEIQVSEASSFNGSIICSGKNISNLQGIEAFSAIPVLDCHNNQITSLDVSKNTAVTMLHCDENQLTLLDASKNTALIELQCGFNQLASLDLSKNTALTRLWCNENHLTALDVSKNTILEYLYCRENKLICVSGVSEKCALNGAIKCK
jgi:Leucine-rich repeat (LRR) protein